MLPIIKLTASLSDPASLPLQPITRSHAFLSHERWRALSLRSSKTNTGGFRVKTKRTLSERFSLESSHESTARSKSSLGRPGVFFFFFRKTLMTMDRANEKQRRTRRKERIRRGAEERGK